MWSCSRNSRTVRIVVRLWQLWGSVGLCVQDASTAGRFVGQQWPTRIVEDNDISVLELQVATIAHQWQDHLSDTSVTPISAEQATPQEYLIQYGDNESSFRYVLNVTVCCSNLLARLCHNIQYEGECWWHARANCGVGSARVEAQHLRVWGVGSVGAEPGIALL